MRDLNKCLDNLLQWIRYLIVAILALLVILKAMLMCGQMHIGIIPCVMTCFLIVHRRRQPP